MRENIRLVRTDGRELILHPDSWDGFARLACVAQLPAQTVADLLVAKQGSRFSGLYLDLLSDPFEFLLNNLSGEAYVASTAVWMVPCPLIMMTGGSATRTPETKTFPSDEAALRSQPKPSVPGSMTSSRTRSTGCWRSCSPALSTSAAVMTS